MMMMMMMMMWKVALRRIYYLQHSKYTVRN